MALITVEHAVHSFGRTRRKTQAAILSHGSLPLIANLGDGSASVYGHLIFGERSLRRIMVTPFYSGQLAIISLP